MRRRDFVKGVVASAAWPLVARAQQTMPVIGLLGSATASDWMPNVNAFRQGLRDAGYLEGSNVAFEARWANGQYERLPAMAAELVQRKVTVIAALSTPAARAAKAATTTIPIVFTTNRDPVEVGLVASLNRPGNITGATNLGIEVEPKLVELMYDVVPNAKNNLAVVYFLVAATRPEILIIQYKNETPYPIQAGAHDDIHQVPMPFTSTAR